MSESTKALKCIRMKDEVYAGIKEIADKEERKIGKVLEMMLEEYKKIQKNEK